MTTKDIAVFIFLWNQKHQSNVIDIFKQINHYTDYCYVVDATQGTIVNHPNWIKVDEKFYFRDKFILSLELFVKNNAQLFLHIQGDTYCNNWSYFIQRLCLCYNQHNFGVYAPVVSNVCNDNQQIKRKVNDDILDTLYNVNLVDETVWAIDRRIVDLFLGDEEILSSFDDNYYGWGFDEVFCALSDILNKSVVLDTGIAISHSVSSGYNKEKANLMYRNMQQKLPNYLSNRINFLQSKQPVNKPESIETFYKNHFVDQRFDCDKYAKNTNGIENFYQPYCQKNGISENQRLYYHWFNYSNMIISNFTKG